VVDFTDIGFNTLSKAADINSSQTFLHKHTFKKYNNGKRIIQKG